ncbi:MAG TPA: D-aminoacyl-tRNA deacylase [Pyrinomonadaceae bacterium]|nr:D-aminoacyl-tRNA deacylase [Pyrinomonadaceae bacterium]
MGPEVMRAVVQRVTRASVKVEDEVVGEIGRGLVVFVGVARNDDQSDAAYLAAKIAALRIFDDPDGRMNLSLRDIGGGVLVVSQFTLYGDVRRGLRPSWTEAAPPGVAEPLYELVVTELQRLGCQVATGGFRRTMLVELSNDGPVTILLDSHKVF